MRGIDPMSDLGASFRPDPKPAGGTRQPTKRGKPRTSPADWRKLHARKGGPCRLCGGLPYELHHLIARSQGGEDVSENLVPLCGHGNVDGCHGLVEQNNKLTLVALAHSLEDAEYAFLIERLGEGALERLFGVTYDRAIGAEATAGDSGRLL